MAQPSEKYDRVLRTLTRYKAMPFLEITALCDIDDDTLRAILTDMEKRNVVRLAKRASVLDEIVTLRESAINL